MRIDKFLKLSRIIIRRTVAKDATAGGNVKINEKIAKPSDNVKVGDIIEVSFGSKTLKIEVLDIRENVPKSEAESLYKIL